MNTRETVLVTDLPDEIQNLIELATQTRANAHAPYSRFRVGAALLDVNGGIHLGCNVENGSFGATFCAERNAVGSAVAKGQTKFTAIAITATSESPCPPCGICRQVMSEFAPELNIYLVGDNREVAIFTLDELLPLRFRSEIFLPGVDEPKT